MEDSLMESYNNAVEDIVGKWLEEGFSEIEILEKLEKVDLEIPMEEMISSASNDMIDFTRANMFEISFEHRVQCAEFDAHQEQLWGKCFVASETMYVLAIEAAELYTKFVEEKVEEEQKGLKQYTFLALQHIHGRACQQFLEIIFLMKHGFADGAYARWRSMYELSCFAEIIKSNGEIIAKQYIEQAETVDGTYSWVKGASGLVDKKRGNYTFKEIENVCRFVTEAWEKQYKLACFVNHASPQGTFKRLANGKTMNQLPVGQSDYGITTAAEHSAISLQLVTMFFLSVFPDLDSSARSLFLHKWVEVIRELYFTTHDAAFKDIDNEAMNDGGSK